MSRNVIAVIDDMFFASKIRATAEALNVDVSFPKTTAALLQKTRERLPDLVVVDLHNQKLSAAEVASALKTDEALRKIKLMGFFSHVQTDLQREAIAAGFDAVIPRSVFARDLAKILGGES